MTVTPIGIAMSGGVDSTACALLLRRDHPVRGFIMDIGQPGFDEQRQRLGRLAEALDIEVQVIDLKSQFAAIVLDYFSSTYGAGLTPNPCMVCNHTIKFGLFRQQIAAAGCASMATGHYARSEFRDGRPALLRGIDPDKDQSYFLARLRPQQLGAVLFPLGAMRKEETYRLVEEHGFTDFRGRESQDVCFLQETSIAAHLAARAGDEQRPGPIVSVDGTHLGEHRGLLHYTIGQRRGIGLPDSTPWYVTTIDAAANTLVVGKEHDLLQESVHAGQVNWLIEPPSPGTEVEVQIRSTHRPVTARLIASTADSFVLRFDRPQRAVAPGQFAVLYRGDQVLGSGEILAPPRRTAPS
ncbi:tRNA 2-thiouridine(34) synthase MnmA [Desulfofustis limnaeus]|uniref:tRNA-specific 2-thiouridylase MnmA n=1 Tax=Desulfofustis limnaeus TaxID=2740163 RepID=A0ABM7W7G4_9BACT|nr:tRNA 2-thiouridine(34) synthase MnmA [Desulfofustis limnaeus]BDD86815.1 tRNA-specific 2-thiouridylase MnmA [Desulfofustis limnaeus]